MYKVFINDKPLIFCSNSYNLSGFTDIVVIENVNTFSYDEFMDIPTKNNKSTYFLMAENYVELFELFFSSFEKIDAAGGVVENNKKQVLLIFRDGFWDLPKGKLEKGEDVKEAAIREVEEECGLFAPEITKELASTYHTYERQGKKYLKKTFWYSMFYDKEHALVPQFEEGITKACWIGKKNLDRYMENSYNSISSLISEII